MQRMFGSLTASIHLIQRLLGLMTSITAIVCHVRLRIKPLQAYYLLSYNKKRYLCFKSLITTSNKIIKVMDKEGAFRAGNAFHQLQPSILIVIDASKTG